MKWGVTLLPPPRCLWQACRLSSTPSSRPCSPCSTLLFSSSSWSSSTPSLGWNSSRARCTRLATSSGQVSHGGLGGGGGDPNSTPNRAITGRKEALGPSQLPSPLSTVGGGISYLDSREWSKDSPTGVRGQRPALAIVCSVPPYPIQYLPGFLSQLGIEAYTGLGGAWISLHASLVAMVCFGLNCPRS